MVGELWKITNHWVKPSTPREVMAIVGAIGVYSTGQRFAWRGLPSADYDLASSLHRSVGGLNETAVRERELEIIAEARKWGLGTHATGRVDDLQLLADLQHFGTPTRLLDVTANPMTALWFACQPATANPSTDTLGRTRGTSGLLLALNITQWPRMSTIFDGRFTYSYLRDGEAARLSTQLAKGSPFVIDSGAPNDRLRAQEGFFVTGAVPDTLPTRAIQVGDEHMVTPQRTPFRSIRVDWDNDVDPETLRRRLLNPGQGRPAPLPFVAVIIDAKLKSRLLAYLDGTYNRSARVLFPDYQGYVAYGQHMPRG